ncbi:sugar phosphate isomerase/epimerase family protein [Demequina phytophila]|uniref:sugar phosphate isomerase/epimerase family protein n=1 Tax=Demequina phytophila TaxID=1638981 RepID=UPI000784E76F|nr:TIM barrel protein [Demequina phytophila]
MTRPLVAIQQIQIGTVTSTEAQARETLGALVAAGFAGIELNSFQTQPTPWVVRALTKAAGMPAGRGGRLDWHAILADFPLRVVAIHEALGTIEADTDAVISRARRFGTMHVVVTGMYRFDYSDLREVESLAQRLNAAGRRLGNAGLRLLYHNHNVEFRKVAPGINAFDVLIEGTDPASVNFEVDCFWAATAGVDPLALMRRLGGRVELCHLTDRGSRRTGSSMTPIDKLDSVELGLGNMDIPALIAQASEAGAAAVVLETHKNWIDGSPVRSAEVSAEVLRRHLVQAR